MEKDGADEAHRQEGLHSEIMLKIYIQDLKMRFALCNLLIIPGTSALYTDRVDSVTTNSTVKQYYILHIEASSIVQMERIQLIKSIYYD